MPVSKKVLKLKPKGSKVATAAAPPVDPFIALVDELGGMQEDLAELSKLERRADVIKKSIKGALSVASESKTFFGTKYAALVSDKGERDVFSGPEVYKEIGDRIFDCCEIYAAQLRDILTPEQLARLAKRERVGPRTVTVTKLPQLAA